MFLGPFPPALLGAQSRCVNRWVVMCEEQVALVQGLKLSKNGSHASKSLEWPHQTQLPAKHETMATTKPPKDTIGATPNQEIFRDGSLGNKKKTLNMGSWA